MPNDSVIDQMKHSNLLTPRELADCDFTVGYGMVTNSVSLGWWVAGASFFAGLLIGAALAR